MGKHRPSRGTIRNAIAAASALASLSSRKAGKQPKITSKFGKVKSKGKKGHSRTMTRTKRKRRETVEAIHGELMARYERIQLYKGKKRHTKLSKGCWKLDSQYAYLGTCNEGFQTVFEFPLCTADHMVTTTGVGQTSTNYSTSYVSLFDANPYQSTTGGALYGSVVTPNDDRIKIKNLKTVFEFTNFTTGIPIEMDIYILQCQTNTNIGPTTAWQNALISQALGKAAAVQSNTALAYTAGYGSPNFVNLRPDMLPEFRKYWKIIRKKRVLMASGSNFKLTEVFDYGGKNIDKKYVVDAKAGGNNYIRGLSHAVFGVYRGGVVKDVTANLPTVGAVEIGCIYSSQFTCTVGSPNRLQTEFVVPMFVSGNTLANQKVANVVDTVAAITQT